MTDKRGYGIQLGTLTSNENRAYDNVYEQEDYLSPITQANYPPHPGNRSPPHPGNRSPIPLPKHPPKVPSSYPPHAGNNNHKRGFRPKHAAFDSGVGDLGNGNLDSKHEVPPSSPGSYDYADCGHQYEELPGGRKSTVKIPMDGSMDAHYQSSGGASNVSTTEDTANIVNEKRKRVNPLYDHEINQSMKSIYSKTRSKVEEALYQQVKCLRATVIILVIISIAALAVSAFAVYTALSNKAEPAAKPAVSPQVQQLLDSFEDHNSTTKYLAALQENLTKIETDTATLVDGLKERINTVEKDTFKNANALVSMYHNLEQKITDKTDTNYKKVTDDITALNLTLQLQIHNLTKQQGPQGIQGFQGVANFSLCTFSKVSANDFVGSSGKLTTIWKPDTDKLDTTVTLSATCMVTGGEQAIAETQQVDDTDKWQHRCACTGGISNARRYCFMHVIECPRES